MMLFEQHTLVSVMNKTKTLLWIGTFQAAYPGWVVIRATATYPIVNGKPDQERGKRLQPPVRVALPQEETLFVVEELEPEGLGNSAV